MAIEMKKVKYDDLDGSVIEEGTGGTCSFALFGDAYELELSKANQDKLAEMLAPYIEVARKAGAAKIMTSDSQQMNRPVTAVYTPQEARAWLIENGHEVPARGRLPLASLKIFEEAHGL